MIESRLPGARLGHETRIEPSGAGVEIANRAYIRGPLARLYALMMGRSLNKRLPDLAERQRLLAERGSKPSSRRRRGSRPR
jgi:hypothetical protein